MQTCQEIQQLLASAGLTPNKRRGQNFLIDLNLMRLLVESVNIRRSDIVLEVGSGTGSLTEELVKRAGWVIAVEIDDTLIEIVKERLAQADNIDILNIDVLESKNTINAEVIAALQSAKQTHHGRLLLVANLPYSAACPTMLNLITGPVTADSMYVTVQKEVAQRMTAGPDSEHYGSLSIVMAAAGNVKLKRTLKPTVFWPPPQVASAMIEFNSSREKRSRIHSMELLGQVVGLFMQHRRKMVRACTKFAAGRLESIQNWPDIFSQSFIDPQKRPEELTPENYISIANLCFESLKNAQS